MLYLTLRHYEYICAIARHGSLSAAATNLNVSQPSLSVALSRIEDHLDQRLFLRRRGAPMVLTPQGRTFAEQAELLLAQAARLENPEHPPPQPARLTLGCFVDLAPFLLARSLTRLRAQFPDLAIDYRVDDFAALTAALLKGQIDLAITYDLGLDAGFERCVAGHARPYAVVCDNHPLALNRDTSLAELAAHPLILFEEGLSVQHVLTLFRGQGLNPRVAHRAASLEILRSLAAHGEGVGISYAVPPGAASYDNMPVHAIPIRDDNATEPIIVTRHGTDPVNPLIGDIMACLSKEMGLADARGADKARR